jgi:hypothetical protein
MPRSLDLDRLRRFEAGAEPAPKRKSMAPLEAPPARCPSREPARDGQVSIKAPAEVIERFRTLCRDDRRTYADMLEILMDRFEGR